MDKEDLAVLRYLQVDARSSTKELARGLKMPVTTAYAKIKKLEKAGMITGYRAILDPKKLDVGTLAFILVTFSYRASGEEKVLSQRAVAREVAKFAEVQEVHIISGDWDLLIKVRGSGVDAIGSFVVDKLRTVKGIEKTVTCLVFETAKETTELAI